MSLQVEMHHSHTDDEKFLGNTRGPQTKKNPKNPHDNGFNYWLFFGFFF
jgi:hypothetical protein